MPQMVDRGGENELRDGMGDILLLLEFTGSPLKKLVPWLHWPSGSDFFIYGFPYCSRVVALKEQVFMTFWVVVTQLASDLCLGTPRRLSLSMSAEAYP
ncbi:hypothetical protein OIU85_027102 [Salix viminalis]|uniref:Uncharacterized protein n=1 Tax=Salix viminalis TaxID=40686 RepID=A0A9Q0NHZ8_SALVM|nr:hypothetical protein OIU85_027102 [Salix viminalis]